jgi:hypothetical protein
MARGFKASTFLRRGHKFVASAARRGMKFVGNLPQHLNQLDELGRKATNTFDKAAMLAGTAGNEFGNSRLQNAAEGLYNTGTSIHNIRHGQTANMAKNMSGGGGQYWTPANPR